MSVLSEAADAAPGTTTTYSIGIGDYFFGSLSDPTDSDWIRLSLVAGQTYTFGLAGVGALDDSLDDAFLRLRDSTGTQIASDDDDGPGRNSTITFTAITSGTYYLDVQSYDNLSAGDYGLSMVEGSRASYDVTMGAGALLRADTSWAATPGTAATVTWGVRASGPALDASGNAAPFAVLSTAQIAAVDAALAMFGDVSGLNPVQVNPGGTTDNATILVGAYNSSSDGAGAYAYYPGSTDPADEQGDVWLNNHSVSQTSLPPGSFSFYALLHEIGHAIGLAHPGDDTAVPGAVVTYANNAQFTEDTHQYSIMSYFDESNTTDSFASYPDTLMLYDIYALHQLYGADATFHAGDTTYGFNATVGGVYDFTTNTDPALSIWDGGGTDTLDLSGYSMAQTISLQAGAFSSVGGYSGNLSIAIGAVIENAVGGAGNDTITGNSVDNTITGNGGNDNILGGSGDDTLVGGAGADTLNGGDGIDTASYADATGSVGARLDGGVNWRGAAGDVILNVENLTGSAFSDTMVGSDQANLLIGGAGSDTIYGLGGNDTIKGGEGSDLIFGQSGNNLIQGDTGDDTIFGGAGNDTVEGGEDNDHLTGLAGNDSLDGGAGDDTLVGGDGADTLNGGEGSDWIDYTGAVNSAGTRFDGLPGWSIATGDVMLNIENAIGTDHRDIFVGSDVANRFITGLNNDKVFALGGNDTLEGGSGDDTLYGQADDDLLIGGGGADYLNGGTGSDTVSYAAETSGIGVRLDGGAGWGAATGDVIAEVENLIGTAYNDTLVGDARANLLQSGDGNDKIYALGGDDTLVGGEGDDTLYGQAGSDIFVFQDNFGHDVIADFAASDIAEQIDLSGVSEITGFADLMANHITQVGTGVLIDAGNGNDILLASVALSDLSGEDFIF